PSPRQFQPYCEPRTENYRASSATPPATNAAAIHRRPSTRSCRKMRAATALVTNVSDAEAGTTSDTSPHDSASNRLKYPMARNPTPIQKRALLTTARAAPSTPRARVISPMSPTCCIAPAIRISPAVEESTMAAIPPHVYASRTSMQLLARGDARPLVLGGVGRSSGNEAHPGGDQQNPRPARHGHRFTEEEDREQRHDNVAERRCRQDERQVGPGKRGSVSGEKADEQQRAAGHPGVEQSAQRAAQVVEGDRANVLHAARKHRVADRAQQDDGG